MKKKLSLFIFLLTSFTVFSQVRQVTGTITDKNTGSGLPDVSIVLKGTNTGTFTDAEGKFSLPVAQSGNVELELTLIGYSSQIITADGVTPLSISMDGTAAALDELVVIGYGSVKKRDLTGSVVSIKSDQIKEIPAQNPLESIQGKVAGVDITRGSGSTTAGINITIRGNRSIGAGNGPLFIVDGIQTGSIEDINPNSIESIEFLKDASSTAIYGWQGANGIVIVTTKKGTAGKPKVSVNSYVGLSQVSRYPSVYDDAGYTALKREAYRAIGKWKNSADDALIFNPEELAYSQKNQFLDYQKLLFHQGLQQNHNVGVSAGTDKTKLYFGLDYLGEDGILKFDNVRRFSLRTNIDQTFNKWIKAGIQSQITRRDENYRRDPLNMANKIIPFGVLYDANGDFVTYPSAGSTISPLADEQPNQFSSKGKLMNIIANAYVELKPFNGFTFRSNLGSNIGTSQVGEFNAQSTITRFTATGSLASMNSSNSNFINFDNVATYQKEIKDHSFTVTALSSYVESVSQNLSAQGEGQLLPSQLYYALGNAANNIAVSSGYSKWNVLSFAGRLNYSYKGKYLVTLTDRYDGASRLAVGNKWASFPSAAVAWRISDEGFMKNVKFLSDLKLRLSYGVSGNSGIQPYGTQSSLARVPMAFGEASFQGFAFSPLLGNPNAGWELSATKNLGFDFGLLKDRISANIDIYDTQTSDLLLPRGLPPTTGVQTVYQNIGATRNRGYEIMLNSVNVRTKNLTWTSSLSYSHNKEEIVSLTTGGVDDIGNGWFIGQPISVFYDYEKLGIWQTSEVDAAKAFGQVPGDIKVKDQNGDGKIVATQDRVVLAGNNRPNWFGGLNNKVTYKGFDLSVYLFARWGQTINPTFLSRYDRQGNLSNSSTAINYWTPENPSNDYPRPNANVSNQATLYFSTIGYVDGSYLRLRNLSLGYTFPVSTKAFFIRVYANATNPYTWTKSAKLKEYDPERGGGESAPMLKNVVFGINLGF